MLKKILLLIASLGFTTPGLAQDKPDVLFIAIDDLT